MNSDRNGHRFIEVGNIRLTFIPKEDREQAKDWAGSDVIRIQAYQNDSDKALHMGAEYPVADESDVSKLMLGIHKLWLSAKV